MNGALVSIIIPVYNAEKYVADCVSSAINQTWPNKEIIIVDDGSTDNSLKIARQYECGWIRVLTQENRGAGAARNTGLKNASGEFIQFLDADDILSPDKIKQQVNVLSHNTDKIAVCSTVHFNDGNDYTGYSPSAYEEGFLIDSDPVHFLINLWGGYSKHGSMVQPNAWLTPRHILDKAGWWDENLNLDDDGEYFCRVILASAGVIKTKGYNYYRKYRTQISLSSLNGYQGKKSLLNSAISKKRNLLKHTSKPEAQQALYKMFMDIIVATYLVYPDIYLQAQTELPAVKPPGYNPSIGGPVATFLSNIFGWKLVRRFQLNRTA